MRLSSGGLAPAAAPASAPWQGATAGDESAASRQSRHSRHARNTALDASNADTVLRQGALQAMPTVPTSEFAFASTFNASTFNAPRHSIAGNYATGSSALTEGNLSKRLQARKYSSVI